MGLPAVPVVSGVLSLMVQLAETESRERITLALAQHRAGLLHDLIQATVHKRVDAIRAGFEAILAQYGAQAEHFMAQQRRYAEEEIACTDPIRRVELRSRMREADKELQTLRIDAQTLYAHMLHAMGRIGVPALDFGPELSTSLALGAPVGSMAR